MSDSAHPELESYRQRVELAEGLLNSGLKAEKVDGEDAPAAPKKKAAAKPNGHQAEMELFGENPVEELGKLITKLEQLESEIKAAGLERVWALETRLFPVVLAMQRTGIRVDGARLKHFIQGELAKASDLGEKIQKHFPARINLSSPQQLLVSLNKLGLKLGSTKSQVLSETDHPIAGDILSWRSNIGGVRQAESYLEAVASDGRVHPTLNQFGAATGRFSCKDPNLQAVGRNKELRACFIPAEGCKFVIADYSQIELRLAAFLAKDETMLQAFRDGKDIHAITAARILGKPLEAVTKADRQLAKAVNFGLLYGQGANGLMKYAKSNYGVSLTEQQAQQFRKAFFDAYSGIRRWHDETWLKARDPEVTEARTLLGRRRVLLALNGDDKVEWKRFTDLINHPVQGLGGDIIKLAMCELAEALKDSGARMVLTVHDELVVEAPTSEAECSRTIVEETMVHAAERLTGAKDLFAAETVMADSWAEK